uniref:DUF72 domain-containing protein n=1 Tax=Lotharella oceanica TaxID=641309 RepID=A0A7S2U4D7_9EUKA|mmetsp:Transcript_9913/g.19042  ORF Transcript_9913/g.19042 Transcript_9913/m.19042 type:complete len:449 (+) Transcript_9913:71-1417(+)
MTTGGQIQENLTSQAGRVIHGTCGWSDSGAPWHKAGKTAAERLRVYSRHYGFGCVEVDTTCYSLKHPTTIQNWAAATPPGFTFHVKIFGFFPAQGGTLQSLPRDLRGRVPSHSSKPQGSKPPTAPQTSRHIRLSELPEAVVNELWRRFNAMLQPLISTKKMGAVLVQFHTGFAPSEAAKAHVRWVRAHLRSDVKMAVEFRNRSWLDSKRLSFSPNSGSSAPPHIPSSQLFNTCELLRGIGAKLVASDDLLHEVQQKDRFQKGLREGSARVRLAPVLRALPRKDSDDGDFAYCRVHRRHGTDRLMRPEEIQDWVCKLRQYADVGMAGDTSDSSAQSSSRGPVYFLWGTDHADQPIKNRRMLDSALPEDMRYDWAHRVREIESRTPGSIRSMFAKATQKPRGGSSKLFSRIEKKNNVGSKRPVMERAKLRPPQKKLKRGQLGITSFFKKC